MAENLDEEAAYIEQHVIIGEISPSLPLVKEEILNYYDNDFDSTPFSVQLNREPLLEECESRHLQPLCSGLTNNDNSQNMLLNCNKIILGSKPNRVSSDEENLENSAKNDQENNEASIDENYFEELVTSYEPSVVLHDIQSYLYKSKRFCDYCSILFPEPNSYENHVQIFHSEKCSTGMSRNESLTERRQHKCTICAKLFVAPHVLRRHLMNIHKLNNANVIENTTKDISAEVTEETTKETNRKRMSYENTTKEVNAAVNEITVKKTNVNVIKNTAKEACATGFENITKETKAKVIENTMKATNTPKINHASSDLSNTCFHCKKSFDTQKSLIEHLYDVLQMKRKNTEIVPVLKSILFKCNKCDIHFTSSLLAANHAEHMEMLINWKCTICNRIFKKEDELSHERQHSVSNNFMTYNLGDLDVTNILFRCSKCATHFTESNFLYHYRDCGLEVTKTVTCKICNILLDYNLKTLHEFDKHTEAKPFTIIQCDVISDNPVKSTVNKSQTRDKLKELLNSFREVKIVLQKMDSNKINRLTKSGTSEELPKIFQDNEASGKLWCTRLRKSNKTSQKYRLLHGLNKNRPAKIADHSVLRRRNLAYSYCRNCKCFITKFKKAAHFQGSCKKLAKMACTCEQCGLILNRASIMTHRRLHMERKDLKLANFRFFNLFNGRSMNPPIPEYPKCTHCAVHFLTKSIRNNHICSEVTYHTCHLCEIKFSPAAFKLHMTFHQYATNRIERDTVKNSQSAKSLIKGKCVFGERHINSTENYTELTHNPLDVTETELTENLSQKYKMKDKTKLDASLVENEKRPVNVAGHLTPSRRNMIYSYCKTCKCFITKFRKSAHVQGRCEKMARIACTCEHCGLILNEASIVTHRRLHEEKKDLKLKNFRFFNLYTGRTMNPPVPEYPNCSHCEVHFLTKRARNNHICSEVAFKTCNICEIKLSEAAFKLHITFHQYASDRKKTIISKNLDAATTLEVATHVTHENVSDTTEKERELPNNPLDVAEMELTGNMSQEYKMNDKTKLGASLVENEKRPVNVADHLAPSRRNMIYSYCKTCKCFITKFRKSAHAQGRCKKMARIACTCEHCGLILNEASIVTHRRLHEEKKDLKLKHFRFFNLYTGQTMNPPVPEYPNCSHCEVHFLTKPARNNHICSEVAFKTCNICEIKLSEAAFKLHIAFHQYASDRKKTKISKNLEAATTLEVATHVTHENFSDTTEKERELPNNPLDVAETELTGNMSQEYKMNDKTKLGASLVENEERPVNDADHLAPNRRNMIYSYCKTCKCFITKFRKSAHAQGRCKKMARIACTCEHCGLILNEASIVTHRRLHEEKKDLKLKYFRFFNLYTGRTMNPPVPEYPNCSHCQVHFLTKPARNNHICSEVAFKTCNICEIKLSEAAFKLHITFHQYASDRKKTIISKNLEAATTLEVATHVTHENVSDTTEKERELPSNPLDVAETELTGNLSQEYKMNDRTKLGASLVENEKTPVNVAEHLAPSRRNMIYSYCKTCKCFITKFKKSAHAQGRCKKMARITCTCEHCGLILNEASIVTHRRLHEERKDLELKHFRFFNLYTGRTMNPPVPEYPNCSHCEVHFLTKPARNNHTCSEVAYKTCNLCETKLSEAAFKLHITFHQYATDRKMTITSKNLEAATTLEVAKRVAHENVSDTTEDEKELPNNLLDVAEIKLTAIRKRRNICRKQVVNKKRLVSIADLRRRNLAYSYCETCKCFVTKFKNAIHVQGRCKNLGKMACICEYCGLIFNSASIVTHRRLHKEKKDLKLKNFRFFNLYDGRSTNPPIPDYPKCDHCAVHFLTEKARNNHICNAEAHQTCHVCEIKLSEAAFKFHMTFHQYATDRINRVKSKNLISTTTLELEKCVTDGNVTITENDTELEKCVTDGNVTITENDELKNNPLNLAEIKLTEIEECKNTSRQYKTYSGRQLDAFQAVNNKRSSTESYMETIHNQLNVAETKQTGNISQEYKINNKTQLDASLDENKKKPVNIADHLALRRPNMIYSYCETCKCFITKFRKDAHAQGRCKEFAIIACTCEHCGLILSDVSIVTHRRLHEEKKDLKLKNFRFFNLYTGRSMNPPVPEYPKCSRCAVHFLTKKARDNHICSQQAYQACHLCEIKLSQAAFKLHMNFHQYATDRSNRVTPQNSQPAATLDIEKRVINEDVSNSTDNYIKPIRTSLDLAETKLTADTSQESKMNDKNEQDDLQDINKKRHVNIVDHLALRRRNVTYSYCEICKCFVTKFSKATHLQERCKILAKNAYTCELCGLILTDASVVTHRRLHEERKDVKLKHFRFFNLYTGRSMNPPIPEYPKCTQCAVQFLTKTARNNHICSEQSYQMCHLCESKLSEAAFKLHMKFHQYPKDRCKKVTTMNSQSATTADNEKRLTCENVTTTENDAELKNNPLNLAETRPTEIRECKNTSRQYKTCSRRKLDAFQAVDNKRLNVKYSFCETCKCFITNFKKDVHVQGRCENMAKIACTCEQCGLVLNSASIVTHRRLHEKVTDLKLKNFRFFNLYTGRSTNPPIPEYPNCSHCAVHFLTKTARKDHVCGKDAYQTCHLCEIKLTEAAFLLHMSFHQYATERIKKVVLNNSKSAMTLDIEKPVTNEYECKATENETELVRNPLDAAETPVQNSSESYEIVYTCGNCSVSVDTYDKVVEHSQRHYENKDQETQTKVCNYCELTIDAACYTDHHNLHEKEKELKLLKFDSYYLPADNNMWVKHIFETLPKEKVLDILRSSIYRFECRMKMDIIQQGDPNLTVYKCDQCSCFIEPSSLFKHSDNSCFKLRHHPCTVCGIPFNSSASRIDHEKIHNCPGITTDSYRIVVFNRERDKQMNRSFCLRKNYVLYQCRKCGVIIDKLQGDIHTCDVSNVKKCPQCALLLHSKEFEKHVNTHKEFVSFNYSNMKIVILGDDNSLKDQSEITLRSNFKGAIYDYKMYICNKCETCVKNEMCMSNHICRYGKQRLKCLKCDIYFSAGRLKTHTRSHEQDPDFVRSNMNLVSFDPCTLDQNKNTTTVCSKDCELSDSNTDSDTEILAADDTNMASVTETIGMRPEIHEEESVKLYKCTCGLHFLNEDSIIRHFGVCRSMTTISKQKCSKCDLLFTPNVLFTHILAHHSRNSCYKYDVIEIDHSHKNIVQ